MISINVKTALFKISLKQKSSYSSKNICFEAIKIACVVDQSIPESCLSSVWWWRSANHVKIAGRIYDVYEKACFWEKKHLQLVWIV